jgi:hypothetical protein
MSLSTPDLSSTMGGEGGFKDLPVFIGERPPGKLPKEPMREPMARRARAWSMTAIEQSMMKKVRRMRNREVVRMTPMSIDDESPVFFLPLAMAYFLSLGAT